jgi:hypothetical protein
MEIELTNGGQLEDLGKEDVLKTVTIYREGYRTIQLWLNKKHLSKLTICEALDIRDALNEAIKEACNIN